MPPKLIIEVVGETSGLEKAFGRARSSVGGLALSFGGLVKSVVVVDAVQKAIEGLTGTVHAGINEFKESAQIQAQTAAALKSTGDISGETAASIHGLSVELSNLSGQSDESIQSAENVLLSFTNIRNSLGKNNDVFTQATKSVVDFAARTGKDAPAAAVLLGKALQDPAKRVGILARAGVVLSQSQTAVLKSTEKTKGILAAQKILLSDLADRFKGAAAAAGQTLPGSLNILKERFRDLAGEGVKAVSGPLKGLSNDLAAFVVKLTDAHGATAKLDVLKTGLANLGTSVFDSLRAQFNRVDFRAIGSTIEAKLKSIDWPNVIKEGADGLSTGIVTALDALRAAIGSVNWSKVGKAIVDGLVIAIAAVVKFLASVDWGKVARAAFKLLEAAFKANVAILEAIGKEVGRLLLSAIGKGLTAAGVALEKEALKLVLAIVEPFSSLPKLLGGGPFQDLKAEIQQQLADLGASGNASAQAAGAQIGSGLVSGIQSAAVGVGAVLAQIAAAAAPPSAPGAAAQAASPLKPVASDLLGSPAKRKGITADQRNTFFDNLVGRLIDQASDGSIKQQIAKLQAVGGLISARIAATKDVTRRLTLEAELLDSVTRPIKALRDQAASDFLSALQLGVDRASATTGLKDDLSALEALKAGILSRIKAVGETTDLQQQLLNVMAQIKTVGAQARQSFLDALNFKLTKAAATASQQDDLAALGALEKALRAQIKAEGATLDLEAQLFDVQQKRKAALAQVRANAVTARNAAQFKRIGLTAAGDALTPGVKSLKAELGNVATALAGSFLDSSKTRSLISHIRTVLAGGLGAVGRDVRDKIKGILDDIDNQLKNHAGDQTKFRHATAGDILGGLGLKGETLRILEGRLATVGAGGTVPGGRSAQFAGAGASVSFHGPVTITTAAQTPAQMARGLAKLDKRTPRVRRGAQ